MPKHEYSPRQALNILLKAIEESSSIMAEQVRVAIDEGHEILSQDNEWQPKKMPYYRTHAPYSDEEAMNVAISVLKSHLIETRICAISAAQEFMAIGVADPKHSADGAEAHRAKEVELEGEPKPIEIEVEPETVQDKKKTPNELLSPVAEDALRDMQAVLSRLSDLVNFQENHSGNTH